MLKFLSNAGQTALLRYAGKEFELATTSKKEGNMCWMPIFN